MTVLSRRVAAANAAAQVAEGAAAGIATAGMAALETYRLHGRERVLVERIATAEDVALDREQRIGVLRAIGLAAPAASGLAMTIAVLTVGALLVMDGVLTLGGLIACQMLAGLINGPVVSLAAAMPHLQEAGGAFARIDDLQRYPLARAFEPERQAHERSPSRIAGHVRLEGVSFGFAPGQPLLRDITLDIPPGRLVAILGPSGSGKSTLARIIAGMSDPDSGSVLLDGLGLEEWPQPLLRRALQYVPQQAAVFSGSLDENLHLWDHAIRQQDSARAILQTGLHGVVAARAHGMHSPLSSHSPALSGGEVQRLALARALSRAPKVLVLDETTSALDFAAEAEILNQLRLSGATVIVVTHRAGTALRCDDAILLEQGAIVACGAPGAILLRETIAAGDRSPSPQDRADARLAVGGATR
jgi:ABC-type bacteriocin/lantibiotic exporter with double-glycine peptidase domain